MSRHILTVTLNPVLDQMAGIPGFFLGKDFYLPQFTWSAGGKGINVSRALNNMKMKSLATGFIGGMTGAILEKMLDQEKIRHDFVNVPEETRRSLTLIDTHSEKVTRVIEEGPVVSAASEESFLRKFKLLLNDCRWVVISGRPTGGIPDSLYNNLIVAADNQGIKTVLDTSGRPLQAGLEALPFLIKPNLEEAEYIFKKPLPGLTQLKNATRYFLRMGIKVVIISLGEKGAVAADENGCWFAKAPEVQVHNTVGCGDAMVGGLLYGYDNDQDLEKCLKTAVAAGAANCLSLQPGNFTLGQVLLLKKKVKLSRLA